jgi:UPF0755 protein
MSPDYKMQKPKAKWKKALIVMIVLFLVFLTAAAFVVRRYYQQSLLPYSSSPTSQLVTIPLGSTAGEIAQKLEDKKLIQQAWAFEWYIRNHGLRDELQAGTYSLKPNLSIAQIAEILTQGKIATDLVTIFPAKRIDQIRDDLINQGFEVKAVENALDPSNYAKHPALVDKPEKASLEGYLYPESFQRTANTKLNTIIEASLDEMQKRLTPPIRAGFAKRGLTVHQGVILASIIEQEVGSKDNDRDLEDKRKVAQVFLKRIKEGIKLESDATSSYGAILAGDEPSLTYTSAYNTYQNSGLPPGPISNVGENSLTAVSNPASTNFLFFVAGHDCVTRFSYTNKEHDALKSKHGVGCKP